MQWQIIYEVKGTKETWDKIPGRRWLSECRSIKDVSEAVRFILERHAPIKITILLCEPD